VTGERRWIEADALRMSFDDIPHALVSETISELATLADGPE
jgi:hypothetical protein